MRKELCFTNNPKSLCFTHRGILTWLANTELGRDYLGLPHEDIALLLPHGYITKQDSVYRAVISSRPYIAEKLYPALGMYHTLASLYQDMDEAKEFLLGMLGLRTSPNPFSFSKLRFYTNSVSPDANPETTTVDGTVLRTAGGAGEDFTTIIAGAGTTASDSDASSISPYIAATATVDKFGQVNRNIYLFDTSFLTNGSFIRSASMIIEGSSKDNQLSGSPEIYCVSANPASNTALVAADYGTFGTTIYDNIAYASWDGAGPNTFDLSAAGILTINKEGISKFGTRISWDNDGAFGGTWSISGAVRFDGKYAETAGDEPLLSITYEKHGDLFLGQI